MMKSTRTTNNRKHSIVFTAALLAAALLSCGQSPVEFAQNFIANRAPVISITDDLPEGTEVTNGMSVVLNVTASDPDGDDITYQFDTAYGAFSAQTDTGSGCEITVYTNNVVGGMPATVTVTATDSGGATTTEIHTLGIGQLGPEITIDSLVTPVSGLPDLISADGYLKVQFHISSRGGYMVEVLDSVGSIVSGDTEWYYYNSPGAIVEKTIYGPSMAGATTYYCSGEGNYTVRITAKDLQDQDSTKDTLLGVDMTPPSVNAGIDQNATGSITQNGSVTDTDGNGIQSILWEKVSGPGNVSFGTANSSTTTISATAEGTYVIQLVSTDIVGNSASDTMVYNLDSSPPSVNVTSPSNGTTVYNVRTIAADASDSVSGISKVEFYIDGVYRGEDYSIPYEYSWNTTGFANGSHSIKAVAYDSFGFTGTDDDTSVVVNNFGTKLYGTANNDEGEAVATDTSGNIYITGRTTSSLDGQPYYGSADMFVTKYSPSGTRLWTRQLGSSASDRGQGIAVDSGGNVYVTGSTSGSFDGNSSYGGTDWFVVKYNSDGEKQWSKQRGVNYGKEDAGTAIAVSDSGYVYATGYANDTDIVIIKLASDTGNTSWETISTTSTSSGDAIAVDDLSNVYITGHTGTDLNTKIVLGNTDAFIIKYDSGLSQQWIQQFGTSAYERGDGITVSGDYLYVTGYTGGSLFSGSQGDYDIFVTKHDRFTGTFQWSRQYGSSGADFGRDIAVHNGAVYVTGDTAGYLDGQTNSGSTDIFITQYSSDGTRQWTRLYGTSTIDKGYGVAGFGNFEFVTGFTTGDLGGIGNTGSNDIFLIRYDSYGERN